MKKNAHHIRRLSLIKDKILNKHGIINYHNLSEDMILIVIADIINEHSLDDGITLCKDCHQSIHKKDVENEN